MNIEYLRGATPGTNNVIHFNNAGASLMPKPVSEAVINYLQEETAYGGYETARKREKELNKVYEVIGNFINADAEEIAILENATAAWDMGFFSIDFKDGDRILTSVSEYASNYIAYLRLRRNINVQIDVIPNDKFGQTSVEALEIMIGEDVKLISITHIPTNSGLVNPVEKIGKIADQYDCLYLVDACQSVGQYPVDVKEIGCDMLSATGRKYLRGPRGTGFLYVNNERLAELTPPFIDLHSAKWISKDQYKMRDDARRFENWECNYAGILGLKTAVEYASEIGIRNIWNRVTKLAEKLRWKLAELPNIQVHDIGEIKCGIVTFTMDSVNADAIQERLAEENINVSISSKSSTLLDMQERNLNELVRASIHYYNTEEEIGKFIKSLRSL
jgi:selenocysteine lyase/cysteine desulfurase